MNKAKRLSVVEVAKMYGLTPYIVRQYCEAGQMGSRHPAGGQWRIDPAVAARVLRKNGEGSTVYGEGSNIFLPSLRAKEKQNIKGVNIDSPCWAAVRQEAGLPKGREFLDPASIRASLRESRQSVAQDAYGGRNPVLYFAKVRLVLTGETVKEKT